MKKKALGKGLEALFDDNAAPNEDENQGVQTIRISNIEPNKSQPRKDFEQESLLQLADSIRQHGVLQPILVKQLEIGTYRIIAGERRWRAARMAGLTEIPAMVKEMSDMDAMEIALIENLQREDLNPVEESLGYKELADKWQLTQEQIAAKVGKSRPVIANALRILNLPSKVLTMLKEGKLSPGHARSLLAFAPEDIETYADIAYEQELTVRELEEMAARLHKKETENASGVKLFQRDSFYDEMEIGLKQEFGKRVAIKVKDDKGKIEISFKNREELNEIARQLTLKMN